MNPIDPALFERDDMRAALARHDIGTVYRLLADAGMNQRRIAELTMMRQSEVSEILNGRRVENYNVLVRIASGLRIPRRSMGLSYGEDWPDSPSADKEVDEDMKRRALITATSVAALGRVLQGVDESIELALPTGEALPSRLGMSHVRAVQAVTERLRSVARHHGGQADLFAAAVKLYTRWMGVPATDTVKARLGAALAELHTEAGWCCYDSGLDGRGFFTRGLRLADKAGDAYGIANAAWHAGATLVRNGRPNDALKAFQLGQFRLDGFQPSKSTTATVRESDPRVASVAARLGVSSAAAYALMDHPEQAERTLAVARENWQPRDVYERADKDLNTARIQVDLGQLDAAEQFAAAAVHTFGGAHRRDRAMAALVLAELNVRAGEPRGIALARDAIGEVSQLHSVPTRERLLPLAAALDARPSSDTRELARMARKVSGTRT